MEEREDKSFGAIPIFKDNNKNFTFCLVQHAAGHWGFPKGHQKIGESEHETAIRELEEETGIIEIDITKNISFIEQYSFKKDNFLYNKSVKYFLGFVDSMIVMTPHDFKKEIPELRWVTYEEAKKLITFLEAKKILHQIFKYLSNR